MRPIQQKQRTVLPPGSAQSTANQIHLQHLVSILPMQASIQFAALTVLREGKGSHWNALTFHPDLYRYSLPWRPCLYDRNAASFPPRVSQPSIYRSLQREPQMSTPDSLFGLPQVLPLHAYTCARLYELRRQHSGQWYKRWTSHVHILIIFFQFKSPMWSSKTSVRCAKVAEQVLLEISFRGAHNVSATSPSWFPKPGMKLVEYWYKQLSWCACTWNCPIALIMRSPSGMSSLDNSAIRRSR